MLLPLLQPALHVPQQGQTRHLPACASVQVTGQAAPAAALQMPLRLLHCLLRHLLHLTPAALFAAGQDLPALAGAGEP